MSQDGGQEIILSGFDMFRTPIYPTEKDQISWTDGLVDFLTSRGTSKKAKTGFIHFLLQCQRGGECI